VTNGTASTSRGGLEEPEKAPEKRPARRALQPRNRCC